MALQPLENTVQDKPRRSKRKQTKDRVLQARIPEQLDEELRDRAQNLGLSVSTIVRNVLLHTFDLVEGVVTDSAQIARAIQGHETPSSTVAPALPAPAAEQATTGQNPPGTGTETVVGWQEAVLNRNGICDTCNTILPLGERAAIGLPVQARPTLLCLTCLAALSSTDGESATPAIVAAPPAEDSAPAKTSKRGNKTS